MDGLRQVLDILGCRTSHYRADNLMLVCVESGVCSDWLQGMSRIGFWACRTWMRWRGRNVLLFDSIQFSESGQLLRNVIGP
jgi:predicted alpha/beta hydrolase